MQIGPYEVQGELGRGGMGVVYRARDPALEREVALKLVTVSDADLVARLRREGRAAARLRHPNIVSVHGLGEVQGRPYLVFDMVQGEGLDARLRRQGPLPVREAVRLVATLARAVEYAHGQGVLHRDLKPANVLIDERGEPHVLDFGLAWVLDDARRVTVTGELMGSPGYMAPEQASGQRDLVGAATDVYGLGATLYALLAGRPPVEGKGGVAGLLAVLEEAPTPVSSARPDVDAALQAIVDRALAKDPRQRWPSAGALAEALERWLAPPPSDAPRPGRASRAAVAAAAVASALLGAGAAWAAASREVARLRDRLERVTERLEAARLEAAREAEATRRARQEVAALASTTVPRAVVEREREAAIHLAMARPHAAVEALEEGRALGGDDPGFLALLGLAYARGARRWGDPREYAERARACLAEAFRRDPDHVPALVVWLRAIEDPSEQRARAPRVVELARGSRWAAPAAAEHGVLLLEAGDVEGAQRALEEALAADPRCPRAFYLSGALRLGSSDPEAATALWEAARLDPTDHQVWEVLAKVCAQASSPGDEVAVRSTLRRLHGFVGRTVDLNLVDLYLKIGDFDAAARLLERMATIHREPRFLLDAAMLRAASGDHAKAMALLESAAKHPGAELVASARAGQAWLYALAGQVNAAEGALEAATNELREPARVARDWTTVGRAALLVQYDETRAEGEGLLAEVIERGHPTTQIIARHLRMRARARSGRAVDAAEDAYWLAGAIGVGPGWGREALEVLAAVARAARR